MRPLTTATIVVLAAACTGSEEAARVEIPVRTPSLDVGAARTNLGYEVSIHRLRVAVSGIEFTIEGEEHTDVAARVATPPPHPGHSAGGEVTGELPGNFIVEWNNAPHDSIGTATLIVGDYHGANFTFRAADAADGLPAGDPLLGHTFHIEGSVGGNVGGSGMAKPFDAILDVQSSSQLVGAVFDTAVHGTEIEWLGLQFYATDPFEQDTAFDDIDFFTLPTSAAEKIEIRPGSDAHNVLVRELQVHDHYGVVPEYSGHI